MKTTNHTAPPTDQLVCNQACIAGCRTVLLGTIREMWHSAAGKRVKALLYGSLVLLVPEMVLGVVNCATQIGTGAGAAVWYADTDGNSFSPTNVPMLTAPCDSIEVFCGGTGCCSNEVTTNVTVTIQNNAGCDIQKISGEPITYKISHPTITGSVVIETTASGPCGTISTTGTLDVELSGTSSCGCGNNSSGAPGVGTCSGGNNCLDFRLFLGPASLFADGGFIWLNADSPSTSLATPAALQLPFDRPNVEEITNAAGTIEQVHAPLGLVNVATVNNYEYQLQVFYQTNVTGPGPNGLYGTNGPAFVTYIVQNPDTNSADNRLWITEELAGATNREFQYTYYANTNGDADRWDLLQPDGLTTISKWQEANSTNSLMTNYFEQVTSGANLLQYQCASVESVPIVNGIPGCGLLTNSIIEGFGTVTQTTTFTYYPTNAPAGSANQLQQVDYPDGRWEYYMYDSDGRVTNEYSAYGNNPPPAPGTQPDPLVNHCKETTYSYTPIPNTLDDGTINPFLARTVANYIPVEVSGTWQLQQVSGMYRVVTADYEEDEQCTIPGVNEGDYSSLYTATIYYGPYPGTDNYTNQASAGKVMSISYPDGTASYYTYNETSSNFTTVEMRGEPDYWGSPNTILDGTETTTVIDQLGRIESKTVQDILTGITLSEETHTYSANDPSGRNYTMTDLAGRSWQYSYDCCGLSSVTDPDDVTTSYGYDIMHRPIQVDVVRGTATVGTNYVLDGLGRKLVAKRVGTDGSTMTVDQRQYDPLGRVMLETNALNGVTTTTYAVINNQMYVTNVYPDGGVRVDQYYSDGQLESETGSAVHPVEYSYGIEQDPTTGYWRQYTLEIKLDANGGTNEWVKTYQDGAGRDYETIYPGSGSNPYSISYYNTDAQHNAQLIRQVDPDGVSTLYGYDDRGDQDLTVLDMEQSGWVDYAGTDHITLVTNDLVADHGTNVRRTQTFVWATNYVDSSNLVSTTEESVDGLSSWNITWDGPIATTNTITTVYLGNGARNVTNTAPNGSCSVSAFQCGLLQSVTRYDSTGVQIGKTTYGYDVDERQSTVTDARDGTTTYGYNNADLLDSVTTPAPGPGQLPQTTLTYYNQMLQATNVVEPDGTSVTNVYLLTGELGETYGSRTYPVEYSYDAQGRMKTMTTWQNFANQTGAATTTWNYDPYRGFLTSKAYADGTGPSYTYTAAGRLQTRTWARTVGGQALVTSYGYDTGGELQSVTYSDGTTPDVSYTYDRLGRQSTIAWNGITETLTYGMANELLSQSYSGGVLDGLSVTNGCDQYLRRDTLAALNGTTPIVQQSFGYDAASRLQTVSDGSGNSATYSYVANSPLVSQIVFAQNGTTRMTTSKQYDDLNRLTQISSVGGTGSTPSQFSYAYNSANQRIRCTLADGSYWLYQYDSLGQLTSAHKYWSDQTPVAGQQFDYAFDTIGNRTQTKAGGDQHGWNQRVANYTANDLNQYTSRDVPGYLDILGVSFATNTVTVNGDTAYRKGEYFWDELGVNNSSSPVWQNVSVAATGQSTVSGNKFVPQTPENFSYDADGNLISDGRWTCGWDAENRLISLTANTSVGPQEQITFAYDPQGRRIEKVVSVWNGSQYAPQSTNLFLYDGWNLVAEVGPNDAPIRTYVWGNDLSGSQQGAGGVGGLLEVSSYHGTQTTNCFVAYDGNGNVAALVNAADGTTVANYEYSPFGELIRQTGPMAKVNPFRFSTKYQDDENDLIYYGYRYYGPSTGRWLSRDPMGEIGCFNLFSFYENDLINNLDYLGRQGVIAGAPSGGTGIVVPPIPGGGGITIINNPVAGGTTGTLPTSPVGTPYPVPNPSGSQYGTGVNISIGIAGPTGEGPGEGDEGPITPPGGIFIGGWWLPMGDDAPNGAPCRMPYTCHLKCHCAFGNLPDTQWPRPGKYVYGTVVSYPVMGADGHQMQDGDGNYLWQCASCQASASSLAQAQADCQASEPAGACNGVSVGVSAN